MNCTEPRLALQGDSIYVVWRSVVGSQTKLYFDYSRDGGANWNSDQVIFDRPARSVQASLEPLATGFWPVGSKRGGTGDRLTGGSPIVSSRLRLFSPVKDWTVPEGGERCAGRGPWNRQVLLRLPPASVAGGMSCGLFQRHRGSVAGDLFSLERRSRIRLLRIDEN